MQDQPAKLYIIVRADLPAGLQVAQVAHAAFEFAVKHPATTAKWFHGSNYIVVLSVPDEGALMDMNTSVWLRSLSSVLVREPDLDEQATALAIAPSDIAQGLCASLPLALRGARLMTR